MGHRPNPAIDLVEQSVPVLLRDQAYACIGPAGSGLRICYTDAGAETAGDGGNQVAGNIAEEPRLGCLNFNLGLGTKGAGDLEILKDSEVNVVARAG